jgi:DedD protein
MRLPFQRDPDELPNAPHAAKENKARAAPVDAVQAARTAARRRLVGAAILLAIGVIGFPMLFETQPRPLSPQLPIVTAQGEAPARAAPAPSRATAPATATAPVAATTPAVPATPAPAAEPASPAVVAAHAAASSTSAHSAGSTARPAAASQASPAAQASPAVQPAASRPAPRATEAAAPSPPAAQAAAPAASPAAGEGRYVVQVGAYSDPGTLRETRQRVEKLGLKTYTQVIEADSGKRTRVRVGPFASRAEAQAAAAKLKAAGLPANLLTL